MKFWFQESDDVCALDSSVQPPVDCPCLSRIPEPVVVRTLDNIISPKHGSLFLLHEFRMRLFLLLLLT
jgi:hypothetical protein